MAYTAEAPPLGVDVGALADFVHRELQRVSENLELIEQGRFLPIRYTAVAKPREGMLVVADGTSWNPGAGAGLYEYKAGLWVKL
jgi:hypothetical protein